MKKYLKITGVLFFLLIVAYFLSLDFSQIYLTPEGALKQFYSQNDVAEDMIMDPLILAGEKVVPLVIQDIKNKNMPRRRYAIGFLGNGSYQIALPVLTEILDDAKEKPYFRGDALIAIYKINKNIGVELAKKYQTVDNHLGLMSLEVLSDSQYANWRRSYSDAKNRVHY